VAGHHRPQRAAPHQLGSDATPGGAGGRRGREQHDDRAALGDVGKGLLNPGEIGFEPGRQAVLPGRVVCQLVVAPGAVAEGWVAYHRCGAPARVCRAAKEIVRVDVVADGGQGGGIAERHAQRRQPSQRNAGILTLHASVAALGGGQEHRAAAAGGIEEGAARGAREVDHERRQLDRGRDEAGARAAVEEP
jgi:hypothetical protein